MVIFEENSHNSLSRSLSNSVESCIVEADMDNIGGRDLKIEPNPTEIAELVAQNILS